MASPTQNPYQILADQHAQGLAYIENNLTANMSFDDLKNLILNFVKPLYFPPSNPLAQYTVRVNNLYAILNLSINGSGYFQVVDGGGVSQYTLAKTFITNAGMTLVTADTSYVLQPAITIPTDASEIIILPDGNVYSRPLLTPDILSNIGQLQIATFANPAGLTDLGNGYFAESASSGTPTINNSGTGGAGTIQLNNSIAQDQFTQTELLAIPTTAVDEYTNKNLGGNYNSPAQRVFIGNLLVGLAGVPVESIGDFLQDIQENIYRSGISQQQQAPLLITVAIGISDYNYWLAAIANAGSNWYTKNYFNPDFSSNRASLPYWVTAAMIGTLSGANKAVTYGQLDPPRILGIDLVTSLTSGLAVASGKVMFKLVQKMQTDFLFDQYGNNYSTLVFQGGKGGIYSAIATKISTQTKDLNSTKKGDTTELPDQCELPDDSTGAEPAASGYDVVAQADSNRILNA